MNDLTWTRTQSRRLGELGMDLKNIPENFSTPSERDKLFQQIEKKAVRFKRGKLSDFLACGKKSNRELIEEKITSVLHNLGFSRVYTPTIITKTALKKMTINENHPLSRQIYWINEKQCLRPMLAPNLYSLMMDLGRLNHRPIRFFEMGPCFRNESDGSRHNSEFTMLNFVEMGLPVEERQERLEELASIVATASGLTDFQFENKDSEVYGRSLDVVAGPERIEVASGAMGPHPIDASWGITDTWIGMGFGIERLLMISENDTSIGKWGKSLSYLYGIRLNI